MAFLDPTRFDHLSEGEVLQRIGVLLATAIARRGLGRPVANPSRSRGETKTSRLRPFDPACLLDDPIEQQMVHYLMQTGPASPRELSAALGLARRTIARKLARLRASGLCEVSGKTKAAHYRLRTEFSHN